MASRWVIGVFAPSLKPRARTVNTDLYMNTYYFTCNYRIIKTLHEFCDVRCSIFNIKDVTENEGDGSASEIVKSLV